MSGRTRGGARPAWCSLAAIGAALWALAGCSTHVEQTRAMRSALDEGRPDLAVEALDEQLGVGEAGGLPADLSGDAALLVLDRASVLLAMGKHPASQRDFEAADKAIDLLDLSSNAGDTIGKYIFSDSVGRYVAPPHEKLLLNTLNLVNYLETDELEGARVEARRLAVMRTYLAERQGRAADATLALSGFLAGLAYERSGDADEALRYYDEALEGGGFGWLRDPVRALLPLGNYRTPRLEAQAEGLPLLRPPAATGEGELVIVVGFGRVPHKIAVRLPIGLALTYFSSDIAPGNRAAASRLAAQGLVTWVNYPTLGPEQGGLSSPVATLDGRPVTLEQAIDVTAELRREWREAEGQIVASAITRMIARLAAGEGARTLAGRDTALGAVLSIGTQATLTALDRPDTRSWETLPARVAVARLRLPKGRHDLSLQARGATRTTALQIRAGGCQVVSLFALR
jgi:uncharacterized protein